MYMTSVVSPNLLHPDFVQTNDTEPWHHKTVLEGATIVFRPQSHFKAFFLPFANAVLSSVSVGELFRWIDATESTFRSAQDWLDSNVLGHVHSCAFTLHQLAYL